jgi:hypothetical protein
LRRAFCRIRLHSEPSGAWRARRLFARYGAASRTASLAELLAHLRASKLLSAVRSWHASLVLMQLYAREHQLRVLQRALAAEQALAQQRAQAPRTECTSSLPTRPRVLAVLPTNTYLQARASGRSTVDKLLAATNVFRDAVLRRALHAWIYA